MVGLRGKRRGVKEVGFGFETRSVINARAKSADLTKAKAGPNQIEKPHPAFPDESNSALLINQLAACLKTSALVRNGAEPATS